MQQWNDEMRPFESDKQMSTSFVQPKGIDYCLYIQPSSFALGQHPIIDYHSDQICNTKRKRKTIYQQGTQSV